MTSSQPASIEKERSRWLAAQGVTDIDTDAGPIFETRDLAIQAAIAQMGVAIVDPRFIEAELAAGQLTIPFDGRLPLDTGYWLVWRPGREGGRPLAAFRQWLAEELALTRRGRSPDDHERRKRASAVEARAMPSPRVGRR